MNILEVPKMNILEVPKMEHTRYMNILEVPKMEGKIDKTTQFWRLEGKQS